MAGRELMGLDCVCTYGLTGDLHLPCPSFAENRRGKGRSRAVCALRECGILPAPSGEPRSATHSMNRYQVVLGCAQ